MTGALYRLDPHEAALIQWWRQADGQILAVSDELRDIAQNPTAAAIGNMARVAWMVRRLEWTLDQIVQAAREDDYRARTVAALARLTEPQS